MLARALEPRLAEQARLASTSGRMWSAAFSPDGRQIVTTDDRAAQVWDAQTYRRTSVLFHGDTVYHALYSADGARIVTAGGDGTVKIWDAASGALVRELRKGGTRLRYFIAALSPDGRLVAAIDTQGDVAHVWDAATGALVAEIHNDGLVFPGLAFSHDGHWLAATGGGDVRVIDTRTPARRRGQPRWHRAGLARGVGEAAGPVQRPPQQGPRGRVRQVRRSLDNEANEVIAPKHNKVRTVPLSPEIASALASYRGAACG
jgi:YD repeat-containing protein